jgi:hypothetical protein
VSLKHFAVIALFAAACFFGGCMIEWNPVDKPNNGGGTVVPPEDSTVTPPIDTSVTNPPPTDTFRDSSLVGDWRVVSDGEGYDAAGIEIYTLTASGDRISGGFFKVGDFWIESWEKTATWHTGNDTLYEDVIAVDDGPMPPWRYAVSGGRATFSFCLGRYCDTTVMERVDVAAVRSRLGTIQTQDPALFTSTAFIDLMWYSENDEFEIFDFDMMYFWDGERYFGEDYYDDQVWYTAGSRLFLIGMSEDGEVEKTVELEYGITGSGSDAKLSIRPILPDGTPGPADIWLPAECDDWGDWEWLQHKLKQSKRQETRRKGAFASSWLYKVAARYKSR